MSGFIHSFNNPVWCTHSLYPGLCVRHASSLHLGADIQGNRLNCGARVELLVQGNSRLPHELDYCLSRCSHKVWELGMEQREQHPR